MLKKREIIQNLYWRLIWYYWYLYNGFVVIKPLYFSLNERINLFFRIFLQIKVLYFKLRDHFDFENLFFFEFVIHSIILETFIIM